MPNFTITHEVKDITSQKATALRDKLSALLEDEELVVIHAAATQTTERYVVTGFDTRKSEGFSERVEATDADAASETIDRADRVVTEVRQAP